jgi:MFS family permease
MRFSFPHEDPSKYTLAGRAAHKQAKRTLMVAAAGTLLVLATFASTVTTVNLTGSALRSGGAGRTWALGGMSLGLATALLAVGALADDFGRRRVFVLSTAGLAAACGLAGGAPTTDVFVAGRILQGMTGAGVIASSLALIAQAFPSGQPRTHATGVWGAMVGGGIAIGPAVSAALALVGSWRTGYWVEALTAALLLGPALTLSETRAMHRRRVDWAGVGTLASGMACLTAAITLGRQSWTGGLTIGLFVSGCSLLASFCAVEARRKEPMLDIGLFKHPVFVASTAGALLTGLALISLMSFLPSLLQRGLRDSALASAGILGIWSVTSMVVAFHARRLPLRMSSSHRLALGFLLCAIGVALLSRLSLHSTWSVLGPGLLVAGIGSGIANAALGRLAVESVPGERAGMGSGANNTARYLGGAAGIALVVALVAAGDTAPGVAGLMRGWDLAAAAAACLCLVAAAVAVACLRAASTQPAPDANSRFAASVLDHSA